ncbi:MAG: hypothetical protein QXD77_02305, partial [Candidatus Aenigmatarchaeota archaeon]
NYINENMNSTDSVLSLAAPEILFLSGKKNINKYPLIESDVFMLHLEKTSNMENFREEIISAKPKFIIYNYDYILDTIGIRDFASDNYNRIDDIKYLVYERIDR